MLKKKINGKKGFTLAELLIVVAIIAILVAISMPILTSKLNDARKATDDANLRAAKAVAVTAVLEEKTPGTYYYDIENGTLVDSEPDAYGKVSGHNVIKVEITEDNATVTWQ